MPTKPSINALAETTAETAISLVTQIMLKHERTVLEVMLKLREELSALQGENEEKRRMLKELVAMKDGFFPSVEFAHERCAQIAATWERAREMSREPND